MKSEYKAADDARHSKEKHPRQQASQEWEVLTRNHHRCDQANTPQDGDASCAIYDAGLFEICNVQQWRKNQSLDENESRKCRVLGIFRFDCVRLIDTNNFLKY